ncbi:MAG: hypothetical protein IJ326_04910 [Lachnospiraceae bacterium]|nr:hypothetical protein [Lachnospiraceae bacterium]
MKKEEAKWLKTVWMILLLLISVVLTGGTAYLYGKTFRDIFLLFVITTACYGCVVFSFVQSYVLDKLHYENGKHFGRFALLFIAGVCASCAFPLLPTSGWVFPVFALAFTLFSNTATGMIAYAGVLGLCVYLANADILTFLMYFLLGAIFAILFEHLDENFKTGSSLFVAVLLYACALTGKVVFQSSGVLDFEQFMMPIINFFITFILVMFVLRLYCAKGIDKEKGRYLDINDQEFALIAKYKELDEAAYYNAIHTAYFAEKIARTLHMDVDVAKAGAYYHKIMVLECKNEDKTLEEFANSISFHQWHRESFRSIFIRQRRFVCVRRQSFCWRMRWYHQLHICQPRSRRQMLITARLQVPL